MSWQDADDDAFDNLLEYIAGTDPTNGASYFVVTAITPDDVALPSVPGRLYQIEANDITDQVWSVVASNQPGTGGMLSIPVSNAVPARWIRARVQMPP